MSTRTTAEKPISRNRTVIAITVAALVGVLGVLWASLAFVKDQDAPERLLIWIYDVIGAEGQANALRDRGLTSFTGKLIIALVALLVGVVGIWALFILANRIVDRMSGKWRTRVRPYVFVGPAMFLLTVFLVIPTISTIYTSVTEDVINFPSEVPAEISGTPDVLETLSAEDERVEFTTSLVSAGGVEIAVAKSINGNTGENLGSVILLKTGDTIRTFGYGNYLFALTDPDMHIAFRNNIMWLIFGVAGAVGIGLLVAQLVDRVKREAFAKTFIFLPMAISFVGAAVIWRFVYWWRPPGSDQIGVLNAVWVWLGNEPIAWMQVPLLNTAGLIVIMIWLMTGFAMVILSAAIKGVPTDIIEAARIDGANEFRIFFSIIVPSISPTIITVATTVFIAILKVFDVVFVMTGGKFDTEVIANRMFSEMFKFRNFGRASSLAVILLIVVIPIIIINVRNLKTQGINA
jgi:alpha-glucoside transport system permease protein